MLLLPYSSGNVDSSKVKQEQPSVLSHQAASCTEGSVSPLLPRLSSSFSLKLATQYSLCEAAATTTPSVRDMASPVASAKSSSTAAASSVPSWWRRTLFQLGAVPALPRVVTLHDPALQVNRHIFQERARDEGRLAALQARWQAAVQAKDAPTAQEIVGQLYERLYGPGVTPQGRTDFLARYGCTAWTDEILDTLVELGCGRGMVELGAGHGQWARALTDHATRRLETTDRPHDFCLAYDDASRLPLNPHIYHTKTQAHHAYFGRVLATGGSDPAVVLTPWATRGRVLLLVYPPPDGSLAVDALRAYQALGAVNDTLVYVGEGRGGSTATPAFWEELAARGEWMLCQILPALSCGTKADDKVFIFRRVPAHPGESA